MNRYHAINNKPAPIDIDKASAPDWARGCDKCRFGVIRHIDYSHGPLPLYQLLPLLASVYLIEFCDCRAGDTAKAYARTMYVRLRDGSGFAQEQERVRRWVEDQPPMGVQA